MTKLETVLERIRQLPPERQDAMAADIELLLEDEDEGRFLSDEQWSDLRARAVEDQGRAIPHEEIEAEFLPSRRR